MFRLLFNIEYLIQLSAKRKCGKNCRFHLMSTELKLWKPMFQIHQWTGHLLLKSVNVGTVLWFLYPVFHSVTGTCHTISTHEERDKPWEIIAVWFDGTSRRDYIMSPRQDLSTSRPGTPFPPLVCWCSDFNNVSTISNWLTCKEISPLYILVYWRVQ